MTLMRWDPFRDLMGLQQALTRIRPEGSAEDTFGAWSPSVDVFENGDDLVIRAELPGVSREDMHIGVENNTLELRGERRKDFEAEEGKTYRRERVYGSFIRRFTLPTTVDATKIAAVYKDGVLQVTLPKKEAAKPHRVEIHAA